MDDPHLGRDIPRCWLWGSSVTVPQIPQAGWFPLSNSPGLGSLGHGTEGCWTMLHLREDEKRRQERRVIHIFFFFLKFKHLFPQPVNTCGTLLELLIFLFPPLPGLEDAPQAGQLTVSADRWSVDPRHQATRSQHPLLVYQLYCSYCNRKKKGGGVQSVWGTATHCIYKQLSHMLAEVMYIISTPNSNNSHNSSIPGVQSWGGLKSRHISCFKKVKSGLN